MKKVSFKIAQAIKKAGYPLERFQTVSREQFEAGFGYKYSTDKNFYSESPSILHPEDNDTIDMYYCPTYIEVWLWLWREKDLRIQPTQFNRCYIQNHNSSYHYEFECDDPEEAIATSIEYLIDNNLIK